MLIALAVVDAAGIDNCQGLRRIWSIDLPHLVGQIRFFVVFGIINGIQQFSLQLVLTNGTGGPGRATLVPGLYMYNAAFSNDQFGYACAIGLVMFLVILALTVLSFRFIRSQVEFEGRSV